MSPPSDPTGLPRAEREALVVELLGEVADLKTIVAAQRDEIARLKGLKGRPTIKPSGMEKGTDPKRDGKAAKGRRRGKVTPRVAPEIEVLPKSLTGVAAGVQRPVDDRRKPALEWAFAGQHMHVP